MPTEKAIKVRDQLNRIIEDLLNDKEDQESNILACCVALSVEEVEKWAYNGDFTPSVAPIVKGKAVGIPFKSGQENDDEWIGSPWNRVKKTTLSGMDALNRLKARTAKTPMKVKKTTLLDRYQPSDWNVETRASFFKGDKVGFRNDIRRMVEPAFVSLTDAADYLNRMQKEHPAMWGSQKGNTP